MVALILSLSLTMQARADPGALRVGEGVAVVVGVPTLSASMPLGEKLEVAAWSRTGGLRAPVSAAGLAVGRTTRLPGRSDAVGWDLGVSAGPTVPVQAPALAVSMTPYARRWRRVGQGELGAAVALPAVVQLSGGLAARLPLQAEGTAVRSVGGLRLGAQASGGMVIASGWSGFSLDGQIGLVVMSPAQTPAAR